MSLFETLGKQCKVIIESPDGKIFEGQAYTLSISQEMLDVSIYGNLHKSFIPTGRTSLDMEIIGPLNWISKSHWQETVEERRSESEWQCGYCGRPNQRQDETCKSCGAVRSFVY